VAAEIQDLSYLRNAVGVFEDFLLSNEIYWPMGRMRLSLGRLLLALTRLQARPLPAGEKSEFERLERQIMQARDHWRTNWERKAAREIPARLTLWRDYLEDLFREPKEHAAEYRYEVRLRVMLELLMQEAHGAAGAQAGELALLDQRLRNALMPGDFIWEAEMARGFPPQPFWYLYGLPRS
jgi:hypothetical protein